MLFQFSKTNFSFILISGGLKSHVHIVLLAASDQAAFEQWTLPNVSLKAAGKTEDYTIVDKKKKKNL